MAGLVVNDGQLGRVLGQDGFERRKGVREVGSLGHVSRSHYGKNDQAPMFAIAVHGRKRIFIN